MPRRSILILEDDPGSAEAFVPMLTGRGYDVRVAGDGEAGLKEIERQMPAALVVDLHLPVLDGLEFLRLLRRRERGIPVAMVTADYLVDDEVTTELSMLGAPLYFKPLWEDDLVEIVERLLTRTAEFSAPIPE